MCGIAGILALASKRPPSEGELKRMVHQLRHRGPEEEGFWSDELVGLAHARLSIIDLKGGRQPIHNETKTLWVVLNGEIFNYVELRKDLEGRGHRFYTNTDTEVIVHLYEELGEAFVEQLNGQFAIGLWDSIKKRLVLARDRTGIVPLFFAEHEGRLLFSSEVKGLLPLLGTPSLDPVALDQLMTFWVPVSPRTMFEGVQELSPGHILIAEGRKFHIRCYWDWSFPSPEEQYLSGAEGQLAEELYGLLLDATRIRLRADIPVGAYLSGGIDSSTIVSLVSRHGLAELQTFSIGFETETLDETGFQRMVTEHTGLPNLRMTCSRSDVAEHFLETVRHTETPVLRTAPTPMKLLSKLVRDRGYKVVLTGEGSDEALGGYDLFKEAKVRRFWSRQPDSAWRPLLLQRLYPYLNVSSVRAQGFVRAFFQVGLEDPDSVFFAHLPRWETAAKGKEFFSQDLKSELGEAALKVMADMIPNEVKGWHPFNRAQYVEAKTLLSGYLLSSQGDRMLMANSVEGRFPFLDHRVIEFANRLEPRFKMRVLREKHLLKVAMEGLLPSPILDRPKHPYRAPDIDAFFTGRRETVPYVDELLSEEVVRRYGYFDPKKVSLLKRKAEAGAARGVGDNQAFIAILSTQIWHHHFVDRYFADFQPVPPIAQTHVR